MSRERPHADSPESQPGTHAARGRTDGSGSGLGIRSEIRQLRNKDVTAWQIGRRDGESAPCGRVGGTSCIDGGPLSQGHGGGTGVGSVDPVGRSVRLEDGVPRQDSGIERPVYAQAVSSAGFIEAREELFFAGISAERPVYRYRAVAAGERSYEPLGVLMRYEQAAPASAQVGIHAGEQALREFALASIEPGRDERAVMAPRDGEYGPAGLRGREQARVVVQTQIPEEYEGDGSTSGGDVRGSHGSDGMKYAHVSHFFRGWKSEHHRSLSISCGIRKITK